MNLPARSRYCGSTASRHWPAPFFATHQCRCSGRGVWLSVKGLMYDVELREVTKAFHDLVAVDGISLTIDKGEFFSLLGPSGCGKTTTLRMIAGFEDPTEGEILILGVPVRGIPPYRRNVNTVFQSYALFPHMNVFENVAFGLKQKRVPGHEIRKKVSEVLEMVKLSGVTRRKIRELSGGQQQRVALARSLIMHPSVLLLDEPLGALDQKLRKEMQLELKRLQREVRITFILVTHDQEEALTLSDRIAVMNKGKIEQIGTPQEIYEQPQSKFVADFIGIANFLTGKIAELAGEPPASCFIDFGSFSLQAPFILRSPSSGGNSPWPLQRGEGVECTIRPETIQILSTPLEGAVPGTIQDLVYLGSITYYSVAVSKTKNLLVAAQNTRGEQLTPGSEVFLKIPPQAVTILSSNDVTTSHSGKVSASDASERKALS